MKPHTAVKDFFTGYLRIYNNPKNWSIRKDGRNQPPTTSNIIFQNLYANVKNVFKEYLTEYDGFNNINFGAFGNLKDPKDKLGLTVLFGDNKERHGIYPAIYYNYNSKEVQLFIGKSYKDSPKGDNLYEKILDFCKPKLIDFSQDETRSAPYKSFLLKNLNDEFDQCFDTLIGVYLLACSEFETELDRYLGRPQPYYFLNPEERKEIEKRAVEFVKFYYKKSNCVDLKSVEQKKYGWDLEHMLFNGKVRVEVKGKKGKEIGFLLTPNEYFKMKKHKEKFKIAVVTEAIKNPQIHIIEFSNYKWRCSMKTPPSKVNYINGKFILRNKKTQTKKWKSQKTRTVKIKEVISAHCVV